MPIRSNQPHIPKLDNKCVCSNARTKKKALPTTLYKDGSLYFSKDAITDTIGYSLNQFFGKTAGIEEGTVMDFGNFSTFLEVLPLPDFFSGMSGQVEWKSEILELCPRFLK